MNISAENKPLLLAFSAIVSLLILVVISGTGIIVPNEEVLILACFTGFVRLAYINISGFVANEFNNYSDSIYAVNALAFNNVKGSLVVLIQCFDFLDSLLSEISVLADNISLYVEFVLERKVLVDLFFKVEDNLLLILRQSSEITKNHQHQILLRLANEIC
jgi:uncharacterized membrane protein